MRTIAGLLLSALLLSAGQGLAQTAGLKSHVGRAVARDLGIETEGSSAYFGVRILGSEVRVAEQSGLHVAAVHAVPEANLWLLRMECSSRPACLPFEVLLRARGQATANLPDTRTKPGSLDPGVRLATPLVRAGQRVELAEEGSGMRLSAPVVCLEAGRMGQRIRVRNVSSGRVVVARVRAAGQVTVEE